MAKEKASAADGRARIWNAIVYPDSAPANWRDVLDEEHIEWAESPLHEFDVNPTGEIKKPHWHIVLSFDGKKSYEQIVDLLAPIRCPIPKRCQSLKGSVRYFAHLDNPEKFQYPVTGIVGHGGFDVAAALAPSSAQRYQLIAEMYERFEENVPLVYRAIAAVPEEWCEFMHMVMDEVEVNLEFSEFREEEDQD